MSSVIDWLLGADPAIAWQVMRDLLDAPESEWGPVRARVETEGWGARLLSHQDPDGQWDGGGFFPASFTRVEWLRDGQPWTATHWALVQLREFGLDPASETARRTVDLVGRNARWDHEDEPFWAGEVEECINGRAIADGAYFGVDVSPIVDLTLTQRLEDGGWNCERENGSVRSSFHSTINVLEGLLEWEKTGRARPEVGEARRSGEEYLLERHLFKRKSTGEPADEKFLQFLHPSRSRYDVLRGLDHFRASSQLTGQAPDPRLAEAVEIVRSRQRPDGTWALDWDLRGRVWFRMAEVGEPTPWITLRALRILRWWDAA